MFSVSYLYVICVGFFFFFKQKTAYEIMPSLVGSEMCIRDRYNGTNCFVKGNKVFSIRKQNV